MNYTNDNRGVIQFRDRARQIINFKNIRFGNITPTDCDGEIEYKNKAWIFFEIKYRDAELPRGQKLALERKVNDMNRAQKSAVCFVAEHYIDDSSVDVNAANCIVREFYLYGTWHCVRDKNYLLGDLINRFINKVVGK